MFKTLLTHWLRIKNFQSHKLSELKLFTAKYPQRYEIVRFVVPLYIHQSGYTWFQMQKFLHHLKSLEMDIIGVAVTHKNNNCSQCTETLTKECWFKDSSENKKSISCQMGLLTWLPVLDFPNGFPIHKNPWLHHIHNSISNISFIISVSIISLTFCLGLAKWVNQDIEHGKIWHLLTYIVYKVWDCLFLVKWWMGFLHHMRVVTSTRFYSGSALNAHCELIYDEWRDLI